MSQVEQDPGQDDGLPAALAGNLAERALATGVSVVAGDPFSADGAGLDELLLYFAGVHPAAIDLGIARLARALASLAGNAPTIAGSIPLV